MKSIFAFVSRNPWIYVVLAFLLLIAAWTTLIWIVSENPVERIEVDKSGHRESAGPTENPTTPEP